MVAISTEVRNRIKNYYDRETEIIFPPAGVLPHNPQRKRKEKYYLLVSRLDYGYKKIDVAIRAFNKLGYQLVVIGTGRLERKLRKMAKRNIKFVGKISEKDLAGYYSNARALIMPQEEDFGIVSVEAQSFGVPVIAYNKGGAIDTVIPEITGVFFERQTPESLINAIAKFEKMRFVVDNLFTNSQRFSKEVFKRRILDVI
jgi:glycosyltransferase involved in cell wall biosynthesis